ncbi:uncharacterized protein F4822DRAFT_430081 [Hypoxylon trugodes]|uniref:uncharacterized protein n=1 Tax=Hypoxylon trugodes TaxID=326681 RepID=UPI00219C24D8|nr:uncharacterized protein F4822DRAFT_430081 [Hypoxylon trugodes]KAI1387325.1 hypothetical protein F4822DRAFT_430081 [Hypoxylon trugodes]
MAFIDVNVLFLRGGWIIVAVVVLRILFQGYTHRSRIRALKAQGLPILPHSLLLGHLPIFAEFRKSHPLDVNPSIFHAWLFDNCSTYFPGYEYPPSVVYLDLWPITDSLAIVNNPEVLAQFTLTKNLPKLGGFKKFIEPLTSCNDLLCTEGQIWKTWRSTFNPGFSQRNLTAMLPEILEEATVFADGLKKLAGESGTWGAAFQLQKRTINLTFDIICRATLDMRLHEQTGTSDSKLKAALVDQLRLMGIVPNVAQGRPVGRLPWHYVSVLRNNRTMRSILYPQILRKSRSDTFDFQRKTVIDLAIKSARKDTSSVSIQADTEFIDRLIANLKIFLFAGHDTTASTICFMVKLLQDNHGCLEKLRAEHDEVLSSDAGRAMQVLKSSPHLLHQLPYTLGIIKETLRLYPLAATVRETYPGFSLTAHDIADRTTEYPMEGFGLWVSALGIQRHPRYWHRPNDFVPERWLVSDGPLRPANNAWIPFSLGPRNCIGMELALMELKLVLILTARTFDIEEAWDEWDKMHGNETTPAPTVNGQRLYETGIGIVHPKDGMPMATLGSGCLSDSDQAFGPRVNPNCRSFDFTLQFEDIFFACLPAAIFLLLLPIRVAAFFHPRQKSFASVSFLRSALLGVKLAVFLGLLAAQVAFLALRVKYPAFATNASLAADVLSIVAITAALLLSFVDHTRSPRPSTLLSLYLTVLVVAGTARLRTFWLLLPRGDSNEGQPVPAIATLVFAFTGLALLLESIEKKANATDAGLATAQSQRHDEAIHRQDSAAKGGKLAPEQRSGIWTRTSFAWLAATFRAGYTKIITLNDLPPLDTALESRRLGKALAIARAKFFSPPDNPTAKHSLLRACFWAYLFSVLSAVVPRLCLTAFTFAQPFLVNATVTFVGLENPDSTFGKGLIGAWALVYMGIAVSSSIYNYQNFRFITRIRGGLIALVYDRSISRRACDNGETTAMALMSTDVERIVIGMRSFHQTWASLLDIAIASWLLSNQMSVACIAPIILVAAFIAATSKVSMGSRIAQVQWIERVQERLKVTSSFLGNMKAVKMLGISSIMSSTIQKLRKDEINISKNFRKLLVWTVLLALTPINLAPVVTFAVYVIIAVFWKNEALLAAQAFTSITLIALLTTPVIMFIQSLPQVFQCVGSFERIQEYCRHDATDSEVNEDVAYDGPCNVPKQNEKADSTLDIQPISFRGQSFAWTRGKEAILKDLNVDIPRGGITIVVGPVGCGKSAFLNSLLGETVATSPSSTQKSKWSKPREAAAYCAQEPWLENKTVRQNIIGTSPYDRKWYSNVICACSLDVDLRHLHKGDRTNVGSAGQNLSGGQKQRIALARAIYARPSVIILDDVFSGMDSNTANLITSRLLGRDGILRKHQTTVIIATHNKNIMALADNIIVLKDGSIIETGNPTALLQDDGYVSKFGITTLPESNAEDVIETAETGNSELAREFSQFSTDAAEEIDISPTDLRRKHGDIAVYKYYIANAGYLAVGGYAAFVTLWMFCTEFSTIIVDWWSEANAIEPNKDVGLYMGIYAMIGVLGVIGACGAAWVAIISIISNTAAGLHADLLDAVVKAPFSFFASTNSGELLNRFSQDMELVDMELPLAMINYTSTAVSIIIKIVILAIFSRYLGITIPFLAVVVYFLQRFYLKTSRQVRLLGIEARAPLYTHFGETTDNTAGSTTIRAFGWQSHYRRRNYELIDDSQRPVYLQSCIQHWLTFVLDLLVAALAVVLVTIVVTWHDRFSAGNVGVSLLIVIQFSETLARLIQSWTKLESSVGAVSRIRRFVADTEVEEGDKRGEVPQLPPNWPSDGAVQFTNVFASYGSTAEPALKNISVSILPGQHVAICGRTGSGKTSFLLALLRMLDETSSQGQIKIDGIDITAIKRTDMRAHINVVPQDSFFVPGTLRFNMDPFCSTSPTATSSSGSTPSGTSGGKQDSDAMIREALKRVGLWDSVNTQGGLDAPMDPGACSTGQKQLLCLARAIVKHWKKGNKGGILVLDEAMSSVDADTESIMQEIIDTEFKDCTVLSIMHRLRHVMHSYHAVMLLESGGLLEFGTPEALMQGNSGFNELYRLNINW